MPINNIVIEDIYYKLAAMIDTKILFVRSILNIARNTIILHHENGFCHIYNLISTIKIPSVIEVRLIPENEIKK